MYESVETLEVPSWKQVSWNLAYVSFSVIHGPIWL